jgi:hypothetical protein
MSKRTHERLAFPRLDDLWLDAPTEKTAGFLDAFRLVSMALQRTLRQQLPAAYFTDLERYRDLETARAILIYQASRVYRDKRRWDLTRDVMNPTAVALLIRMARKPLGEKLSEVETALRSAGMEDLAPEYSRSRLRHILRRVQRLRRSRRCLGVLMRGESAMVDALVQLGGLRHLSPQDQNIRKAVWKKKWITELRRMYPQTNFEAFAPILLQAATRALRVYFETAPKPDAPP